MSECRILWSRYELAMQRRALAASAHEQAAWWAEANEWLGRFFDGVEVQLQRQRQLDDGIEGNPVLKPAPLRLLAPGGRGTGSRSI